MTKAEEKVKLKASYSIMAGDGEKVIYVREAVWIGLQILKASSRCTRGLSAKRTRNG